MTIITNDQRAEYPGNGIATVFTGPRAFTAGEVVVYLVNDATDVAVLQTAYTLTGVGSRATTVTMVAAPVGGETLLILHVPLFSQSSDITNLGRYLPEVVENALDKLAQQTQYLDSAVRRTLRVSDTSTEFSPLKSFTANQYVVTDATGTGLTVADDPPVADLTLRANLAASTGSTLVNFLQSGTGAVSRTVSNKFQDLVSVKDFGAVGDGLSNPLSNYYSTLADAQVVYPHATALTNEIDWAAVQAALNTGKNVYVPGVSNYYKIHATLSMSSNQTIYGDGVRSKILQTTALLNVITATTKTECHVSNLLLYCTGDFTTLSTGSGVLFTGCTRGSVTGCVIENHRGWGVNINSSNDCVVRGNRFINASVTAIVNDTSIAGDIQIVYGSSRNVVDNNHCISGNGSGIKVQSVINGDICDDNVITNNVVRNSLIYGIVAYRNSQIAADVPLQSVARTIISNNIINNVTGAVLNSVTSTYTFGAGIYLQGSESSVVTGNSIKNTHSGAVTFAETLSPGAIGVTNLSVATITGNSIKTAGQVGIDLGDANGFGNASSGVANPGGVGGAVVVADNVIIGTVSRGIRSRTLSNLSITGNSIVGATSHAIEVNTTALTTVCYNTVVSNNIIRNSGNCGLSAYYVNGLSVNANVMDLAAVHGVIVSNASNVSVTENVIRNHVSRGIQITSTVTGASVLGNTIAGSGTSSEGIRLDALTKVDNSNRITGIAAAANWTGLFAVLRGTQSATAVGNVGIGEDDLATYVLPASAMTTVGDTLIVSAWGTTANNANVKTLKMYFGTDLVLTTILTPSQVSPWVVDANIVRTGVGAGRVVARLTQGGAVTIVDAESTSYAQTETAAITVKLTGEATANNDVQQFGMVVRFENG